MPRLESQEIQKLWGGEVVFDNNDLYCGKMLVIEPGFQCSLHLHREKRETFVCVDGSVALEVSSFNALKELDTQHVVLEVGDVWRLEPGTPHRFSSLHGKPATVIEFSTHHDDNDVLRIEESRKINA